MSEADLNPILDDLAAGRIDSAEAARRIERVQQGGEPDESVTPSATRVDDHRADDLEQAEVPPDTAVTDEDQDPTLPSEADLGRSQSPGVAREDFSKPATNPDDEASSGTENSGSRNARPANSGPKNSGPIDSGSSGSDQRPTGSDHITSSWFDLARHGLDRLRHEAGAGFERLREEAETRLGERSQPRADPADSTRPTAARTKTNASGGVRRIAVRIVGRRVRIIGDTSVSTATVDGPHVLRRQDDVIEITSEGDVGPSMQGFSLFRPPRSFDDVKSMGLGKELIIRINPQLILDAEVTGGSLRTDSVAYLGKIRVTVGGVRLDGIAEVEDALIQAGPGTVSGTIRTGRSRVRCESGSLTISLTENSNVTVRAESQLGRIGWAGMHTGSADEVVLGNGSARLDVAIVMGAATIRTGTAPAASQA